MKTFHALLANTLVANIATNYVWFAVTFWVYLETRSVLATGILGGSYMALLAVLGVPFGSLVDRHRKKPVLVTAAVGSVVAFGLAWAVMWLLPPRALLDLSGPGFWVFVALVLVGSIVESVRAIALSASVTLLVPSDDRARANGLVGMANGVAMLICSVLSGLSVGLLGMRTTLLIGLSAMALGLGHLLFLRFPPTEPTPDATGTSRADFRGAWAAVIAIPGLLGLLVFSTFNNFLGGTFMALLDPYGLELMSVEWWGILFAVCSVGFIVGGAVVARKGLGPNPIRTMLLVMMVMWAVCIIFTLRESVWLLGAGIFAYMAIVPAVEAAEQTVLQRTVPYAKQGRVFGLAQAMEVSAAPLSAFAVAPLAEFWLLPYMRQGVGEDQWSWLLGRGEARGIALVFVVAGVIGIVATLAALASSTYRTIARSYAAAPDTPAAAGADAAPAATVLPGASVEGFSAAGRAVAGALPEQAPAASPETPA